MGIELSNRVSRAGSITTVAPAPGTRGADDLTLTDLSVSVPEMEST